MATHGRFFAESRRHVDDYITERSDELLSDTDYSPERSPLRVTWVASAAHESVSHGLGSATDGSGMEAPASVTTSAPDVTAPPNPRDYRRNRHPTCIRWPSPRPFTQEITGSNPVWGTTE